MLEHDALILNTVHLIDHDREVTRITLIEQSAIQLVGQGLHKCVIVGCYSDTLMLVKVLCVTGLGH